MERRTISAAELGQMTPAEVVTLCERVLAKRIEVEVEHSSFVADTSSVDNAAFFLRRVAPTTSGEVTDAFVRRAQTAVFSNHFAANIVNKKLPHVIDSRRHSLPRCVIDRIGLIGVVGTRGSDHSPVGIVGIRHHAAEEIQFLRHQ